MKTYLHNLGYLLKISNAYKFDCFEQLNKNDNLDIVKIQSKYHAMGGGNPKLQFSKLLEIKTICQKYKIKKVLELGTGSSSVVFESLNLNCLHVDENKLWWKKVSKMIGDKDLDSLIKKKIIENNLVYYNLNILDEFDLIYIDGPSLPKKGKPICYDIFKINQNLLPKYIMVDMRLNTVNEIIKKFSDKYEVHISDVLNRNPCKNYRYHSFFIKKE